MAKGLGRFNVQVFLLMERVATLIFPSNKRYPSSRKILCLLTLIRLLKSACLQVITLKLLLLK